MYRNDPLMHALLLFCVSVSSGTFLAGCSSSGGADSPTPASPTSSLSPVPSGPSPTPEPSQAVCRVDQPFPYRDSPYPGLHGTLTNAERIPCAGPLATPVPGFSALEGLLIFNPMTVGTQALYALVARSTGCKLWKVDLASGHETCFPQEPEESLTLGVLAGSPELDEDENVYITDGWESTPDGVVSYTPEGIARWRTTFESLRSPPLEVYSPPLGLHFTPQGYAATVTPDGQVVLLDRETGAILTHFSLVEEGLFAPLPSTPAAVPASIPRYLECRIQAVIGEDMTLETLAAAFSGSMGGSGAFTDNSLGGTAALHSGSTDSLLFVTGGSRDTGGGQASRGALIALRVGGTLEAPALTLAWYVELLSGTGSSPTVDPSSRWVVTSDITPEGRARVVVADLDACAAVEGQPDPLCIPAWTWTLEGSALSGHLSIDEAGVVYAWNQGEPLPGARSPMPPLVALAAPTGAGAAPRLVWEVFFPPPEGQDWDSTQWSSTALVLDDLVIGTVSHLKLADLETQTQPPTTTASMHELVGVERTTGRIRWRGVPVPDDSVNSPLLGPDGQIYVPLYGMIDFMGVPEKMPRTCADFEDTRYQGGLVQLVGGP